MKRIRCKVSGRLLKIQTESFQASGSFGGRIKAPFVLSVSFFLFPPHPPVPFFRQQKDRLRNGFRRPVFCFLFTLYLSFYAALRLLLGISFFTAESSPPIFSSTMTSVKTISMGIHRGTSKIMMNACTSSSTVLQINRNAPIFIWINRRVSNARSRNTTR